MPRALRFSHLPLSPLYWPSHLYWVILFSLYSFFAVVTHSRSEVFFLMFVLHRATKDLTYQHGLRYYCAHKKAVRRLSRLGVFSNHHRRRPDLRTAEGEWCILHRGKHGQRWRARKGNGQSVGQVIGYKWNTPHRRRWRTMKMDVQSEMRSQKLSGPSLHRGKGVPQM